MDVYGVGVLFIGRSGIGKSEIALDLVERGHRLVADDVVILTQQASDAILMVLQLAHRACRRGAWLGGY